MDNYQIYGEIGKGKYSVVYKGRKRKTIEYVAIKSVDKIHKSKVLNEVKIMHALNHPSILKFFSWYETNNHFWLILEFCTGGDLLNLLLQDTKLPEETVHTFGLDLMSGLQYLHSKGILYCDLKPSNILLDGSGMLKLSDFGLAQKLSDIGNNEKGRPKRGTPCYMSPELFQEGGVHSFCSEFWALGCVLYELATGNPPFVSKNFEELMNMILYEPVKPVPNFSNEFNDLIQNLLQKDPADRLTWDELREHPFWRETIPALPLPEQPYFDMYLKSRQEDRERQQQLANGKAFVNTNDYPQQPVSSRITDKKPKEVDVTRISQIVRNNLEKVQHADNYRGVGGAAPESDKLDVRNTDMELDFAESDEEDEDSDSEGRSDVTSSGVDDSDDMMDVSHNSTRDDPVTANGKARPNTAPQASSKVDGGKTSPRPISAAPALEKQSSSGRVKNKDNSNTQITTQQPAPVSLSPREIKDLLWHQSDSFVKPIVMNVRIEKLSENKCDTGQLPFTAHTLKDVLSFPQNELEKFLTQVYKSIGGQTSVKEKINTLCYFETLCQDTQAANLLINSSLMTLFVKMVNNVRSPMLKCRLCIVMGLLIRHATYISNDLSSSNIIDILVELLRDTNNKVKRRGISCLGELLFYVATQDKEEQEQWTVPTTVISVIIRCLRAGEDEVVQHYAAKTIENIAAHSPNYSRSFNTPEAILSLLQIFQTTRNEHLRLTAISALSRLSRNDSSAASLIFEKMGVKFFLTTLNEGNSKLQQNALNILNVLLFSNLQIKAIAEEKGMVESLMDLLEQSNPIVRAKALLSVYLLSKAVPSPKFLLQCLDRKLCQILERTAKEKDSYVLHCLEVMNNGITEAVPPMAHQIAAELEALRRTPTTSPPSTKMKIQFAHLSIILHVMTTPSLAQRVVSAEMIKNLSSCLRVIEAIQAFPSIADFKRTLLLVVESLSQHAVVLSTHHKTVVQDLLPALTNILSSENGDTRFLCLKIFTDILVRFLNDPKIYDASDETNSENYMYINDLILKHLFPKYAQILNDEDPIPLYGLKLLNNIAEQNRYFVSAINRLNLVPKLFEFFELEHPNNNVHNVRLILKVVESEEIQKKMLYDLGLISKLNSVLEYAFEHSVDSFFEPCLEIVHTLLYHTSRLLQKSQEDKSLKGYADALYTWNQPLVHPNLSFVYLPLCSHSDIFVAETSAHCVLLCVQLYDISHEYIASPSGLSNIRKALLEYGSTNELTVCKCLLRVLYLVLSSPTNKQLSILIQSDELLRSAINKVKVNHSLLTQHAAAAAYDNNININSNNDEVVHLVSQVQQLLHGVSR